MPLNKLRIYNELLDIASLNPHQRDITLRGIFNRDFVDIGTDYVKFKNKNIYPTPNDGAIPIETLFCHLTKEMTDKVTRTRCFDYHRSIRLHWVKYHLNENKKNNMYFFSVQEPEGIRTYYYDKDENYVLVLEPLKKVDGYYLLSAHLIRGKDALRDKIMKKYQRKLDVVY